MWAHAGPVVTYGEVVVRHTAEDGVPDLLGRRQQLLHVVMALHLSFGGRPVLGIK